MNSSSAVSITVRYNIPRPYDEKEEAEVRKKKFDDSNTVIMRMGLPPGTPVGKSQPGDYRYTGCHDDGPLPALREGGVMAQLISCVQQAKSWNDEYLTSVIDIEKTEQPHKKTKVKKSP